MMTKETQAWIKELRDNAKMWANTREYGLVLITDRFDLEFDPKNNYIDISGCRLTIEQLEALAYHMKQYSKVK